MCDRSKVEVLAREMAIQYYRGRQQLEGLSNEVKVPISTSVESTWTSWKRQAEELLELLEQHN